MAQDLTPEIVRLGYRFFLGREPESEAAVAGALGYTSFEALRTAFLTSPEFGSIMKRAPMPEAKAAAPRLVSIGAPPIEVEWQGDADVLRKLLDHVKATWTRLGRERPHWSVLSAKPFTPEEIQGNEAAFFASGNKDAADLTGVLNRHGDTHPEKLRLMEFGCGIGRVTPHLARVFMHVDACDVSVSHLDLARGTVAGAGARNVTFHVVEDDTFGMVAPFDAWFSRIVLQHNSPPIIAMILKRALTFLAPGGLAVFQVPTYAVGYRFCVADYLVGLNGPGQIEMHVLPQPVILAIGRECGCDPLEIMEDLSAGPSSQWCSTTFVLRKRNRPPDAHVGKD